MDETLPWWEKAAAEAGRPGAARTYAEGDAEAAPALAFVHKYRWEFEEAERWYRSAADRDGGCAFELATLLN